jgi:lysozyme
VDVLVVLAAAGAVLLILASRRAAVAEPPAPSPDVFSDNLEGWTWTVREWLPQPMDGVSPMALSASETAYALIRRWEGLRLRAYWDNGQWAIGYGHRGPDVKEGMTITQAQAEALLRQDVAEVETVIRSAVRVPLTQAMFDALVSFVYNVGAGAFRTSTLLKKLNAGDYAGAQQEFLRWVYAGGRVSSGLVARRQEEAAIFGGPSV